MIGFLKLGVSDVLRLFWYFFGSWRWSCKIAAHWLPGLANWFQDSCDQSLCFSSSVSWNRIDANWTRTFGCLPPRRCRSSSPIQHPYHVTSHLHPPLGFEVARPWIAIDLAGNTESQVVASQSRARWQNSISHHDVPTQSQTGLFQRTGN